MKKTQTIECKAWNPEGELALHLVYRFETFSDRLAEVEEKAGSDEDLPFFFGIDSNSIASRFVPSAEAAGWTAEVRVEGGPLKSAYAGEDLQP